MRLRTLVLLVSLLAWVAVAATPASATWGTGGALAEGESGDSEAGAGAVRFGDPAPPQPSVALLRVTPGKVVAGAVPRAVLRIDHPLVGSLRARAVVSAPGTGGRAATVALGRVRTNRTVRRRLPAVRHLDPGTYEVQVGVREPASESLTPLSRPGGSATLVVKPKPKPKPKPVTPPAVAPSPAPGAPVAAPAPAGSGAFPVRGPHSFGGEGSRFGAGRTGHSHQGQDIAAAEGLPVVSALAGTVAFTDFQADGAGEYVVVNHDDGRASFYAHCQRTSTVVRPGQRVSAGAQLCRVGSTGRSTGPHLHFELWTGGWRDRGGTPVDPLPFLRSLDR